MKANVFKWKIVAAFAALYLIWGATYLAIRRWQVPVLSLQEWSSTVGHVCAEPLRPAAGIGLQRWPSEF